jgi:penicillin-binding protein 2D
MNTIRTNARPFLQVLLGAALTLCAVSGAYAQDLPPVNIRYASIALMQDGRVLEYFGSERRVEVQGTGSVSKWVIRALLATEDRDFYNHDGVSLKGLGRAVLKTLTGQTQGGSTLTMQLARNLFLSREQTISRKLREIDLAYAMERQYTKDQILLLYLNTVYFGSGNYGIWTAAQEYFQKTPDRLSVTEAAMLVGLLKGPEYFNPLKHPDRALARRTEVLHNLVEVGRLSDQEFRTFRSQQLGLNPRVRLGRHFAEYARKEARQLLAVRGLSMDDGGYRIVTTLDPALQEAAETVVEQQWRALPDNMRDAQIGAACIGVGSGAILAMIGGNPSSAGSDLNHAAQIHRQPGSSFKPFLYGALLERGYTLATPLLDAPMVVDEGTAWEWRPQDDDSCSNTAVPLRTALQKSLNLCAAHAIVELLPADSVAAYAARCGILSPLHSYPSLALGTAEVSPLEMASAYATIASGGLHARPYAIARIEDRNRSVLYQAHPDTLRTLDSTSTYLLINAMEAVVDSGTAAAIRSSWPFAAAGKTGTTQLSTDAWFAGFTPAVSSAFWMGFDDQARKLRGAYRYGGTACAPLWGRMMAAATRRQPSLADSAFHRPESVIDVELCLDSGKAATTGCLHRAVYPVDALRPPPPCDRH